MAGPAGKWGKTKSGKKIFVSGSAIHIANLDQEKITSGDYDQTTLDKAAQKVETHRNNRKATPITTSATPPENKHEVDTDVIEHLKKSPKKKNKTTSNSSEQTMEEYFKQLGIDDPSTLTNIRPTKVDKLGNHGHLMYLYDDFVEGTPVKLTKEEIEKYQTTLTQAKGRNWNPVIVTETGENKYVVIGNHKTFTAMKELKQRMWAVIIEDKKQPVEDVKASLEFFEQVNSTHKNPKQSNRTSIFSKSKLGNPGHQMQLFTDYIDTPETIKFDKKTLKKAKELLDKTDGRNWMPVIVRELDPQKYGQDKYEVVGNAATYHLMKQLGYQRMWTVITNGTDADYNSANL